VKAEDSNMAANAIAHAAAMAGAAIQNVAYSFERPCLLFKPRLFADGNQWCALYGENIHEGVCGFGDTPSAAMYAFDTEWATCKPPQPKDFIHPLCEENAQLGVGA